MANAVILHFAGTTAVVGQPTQQRLSFVIIYTGVDVPGNFNQQTLEAVYTIGDSAATLGTNMRSAIQAFATSQGFTVANGATLLPSYQAI